jgi:hypothetical protein
LGAGRGKGPLSQGLLARASDAQPEEADFSSLLESRM